MKNIPENKKT